MVVDEDIKSFPEELFINDLYKIHRTDVYKEQYLLGTKVKKDRKIINVQEMVMDKTLLRELRDRLNKMSLD
ncbi:hypothetical protein [Candidatus Nitrosocosmicus arcticus]|uniref:Uncharacterized protein n=1 Tax=Candidatus Nitrosocosmicus arcticus TaxID=2035267 RepID=A0A557SYC7_9ARCH|nr:hypothetical protein [Candidatus Nitrosocosmicus arcticus]TVP41601.1 hypothetical protein NARC_10006 [Candidatus Nitrosocosmicus arcticus]